MLDYIVVGCGLAGISFVKTALKNNKSVLVFDNQSQNSSTIAAGIYNPVILKRFTTFTGAQEQLIVSNSFYTDIENSLNQKLDYKIPVYRKFFSIEEQNNWFAASDKISLKDFLSKNIISTKDNHIDAPYGYGEVLQTGFVDTKLLLDSYKTFLIEKNFYLNEQFNYKAVNFETDYICYKNLKAKHIVFAEGFGMHLNPFFNNLPLDGTKGEVLVIKAPNLKFNFILNASVYIVPLGNDIFKVGATYEWGDKSQNPTEKGKNELIENIKKFLTCDFEIVEHLAGIRPTVKDRKPLLGTHHEHKNIHIFNGLGTRGVMQGPYLAEILYNYIEKGIPLDNDVSIARFRK